MLKLGLHKIFYSLDCGQSQFDRTEREIKQREQAIGEHQRTAEQFTQQTIREIQRQIDRDISNNYDIDR